MKRINITVTSIEKLKEEVKTVEELEKMTVAELDRMMQGMKYSEVQRLHAFMEKWGLI